MNRKNFIKLMDRTRKFINKHKPTYLCNDIKYVSGKEGIQVHRDCINNLMTKVFNKKNNPYTGIFGKSYDYSSDNIRLLAFEFFYKITLEEKLYKEL